MDSISHSSGRNPFPPKPGEHGRGAVMHCSVCGKQFIRTFEKQSKCLECISEETSSVAEDIEPESNDVCPVCGNAVKEEEQYCPECGAKLRKEE